MSEAALARRGGVPGWKLGLLALLGKAPWGIAAGALVDGVGWAASFALASLPPVAFLFLLLPMSKVQKRQLTW